MDAVTADTAAYIGRWRPSSVSPGAAAFARDVIAKTAPQGRERAKNLLWAAGKLAGYAASLGLDLTAEVVFHPSVIERLPRLDTSRLRAAWLADCADGLGLATFMHAAGISCSQRLGDLVAGLEPAGEAEAVRLLGAVRR